MTWRQSDAGAPAFCFPLTAFNDETGWGCRGRGQATAPSFGDTEERRLGRESEILVRSVSRRDSDWSDARDVVDGVGEADGGRAEDGRERRRAREGDALSPPRSSEDRRLHGVGSTGLCPTCAIASGMRFNLPRQRTSTCKGRRFEGEKKKGKRRELRRATQEKVCWRERTKPNEGTTEKRKRCK
jgi:hypothetical protein